MQEDGNVKPDESPIMSRAAGLFHGWCEHCGRLAAVLRLEEVALAGISIHAICDRIENGRVHLAGNSAESLFICLNSLF